MQRRFLSNVPFPVKNGKDTLLSVYSYNRLLSKPPPKRQGRRKNERETGVYIEVNEDFELILSQRLAFGGGLEKSLIN